MTRRAMQAELARGAESLLRFKVDSLEAHAEGVARIIRD